MLRALSRVNRQLHTESVELLHRKTSYRLDVAFIDNGYLLPNWVSVPALTKYVHKLYIAIRAVSLREIGWRPCTCEDSPDSLWSFYGILERFLTLGPAYTPERCRKWPRFPKEENLVVKTVEIDIVTPKPEFTLLATDDIESTPQNVSSLSGCVFENFGKFLETLICLDPTHLGDRWPNRDCRALTFFLLYERIGTIRLLHDGHFEGEWDLGDLLKIVQYDASFWVDPCLLDIESGLARVDPKRTFRRWKKRTSQNRRKNLPVTKLKTVEAGPEDSLEEMITELDLRKGGKTLNPRSRRNLRKRRAQKKK